MFDSSGKRVILSKVSKRDISSSKPGSIQTTTLCTVLTTKSRLTYRLESEMRIFDQHINIFARKKLGSFLQNFIERPGKSS